MNRHLARCWALVALFGPAILAQAQATKPDPKALGTIERFDPRFDKLVAPGAVVEKLADGYDWSEGPVWDRKGQFLLFSDVPANIVYKWSEATKGSQPAVFLKPSGYTGSSPRGGEPGSNGLIRDPEGRLVLCQHGDRRVARLEADGSFKTLVDQLPGQEAEQPQRRGLCTPTARSTSPTRPTASLGATRTPTPRRSSPSTASIAWRSTAS